MRKRMMGLALALSVGAGLALAQPVSAQEMPQQQEQVEVTDSLLEDFVEIYPTVVEISQEAQAEMSQASSAEEAQEIQAEANEAITETLEEADMTFQEYDAVIRAINEDPELMDKFRELMEEIHGEGGPGA